MSGGEEESGFWAEGAPLLSVWGGGWECRVLAVSRKGRQANRKGAGAECRLLGRWGVR